MLKSCQLSFVFAMFFGDNVPQFFPVSKITTASANNNNNYLKRKEILKL